MILSERFSEEGGGEYSTPPPSFQGDMMMDRERGGEGGVPGKEVNKGNIKKKNGPVNR